MKVTSNLGNTFFITSAACGLLTFPSNEKLAGWIYSYSLFILYLPDGKSILNCLTNILISSSLKDSILFCCFSFASSSSFCFLFFSNALRALSLGSSKSSLITMDSTKRLKMISQIQICRKSPQYLPQMFWHCFYATSFLVFLFTHYY